MELQQLIVAVLVPVLVAGLKKLELNMPNELIPILAIVAAWLSDTLILLARGDSWTPLASLLVGALAIGIREAAVKTVRLGEGFVK